MLISWSWTHLLLIVGIILAIVLVARMIRQRRSPSGALAWLLIMVLVPYMGTPLYLALGEGVARMMAPIL